MQEEEGGDAEAAQGVRVVYNRWEVLVNVVEKLDAFSDSGLRSDARCDLEGLNDKACATRPGSRLTCDSTRVTGRTQDKPATI